jgi:hypothetical protein
MLYLVPLASAGRDMTDGYLDPKFVGQHLQFALPQARVQGGALILLPYLGSPGRNGHEVSNAILVDPKTVWTSVMLTECCGGQPRTLEYVSSTVVWYHNGIEGARKGHARRMHAAPAWDPQRHHPDPNPMAKRMKTMILEAATRGRLSGSAGEPASPSQPENARAAARSVGEDGEHRTFPGVGTVARSDGARRSAEAPRAAMDQKMQNDA